METLLTCIAFLLPLGGCVPIVVPTPWFPSDPYKEVKIQLGHTTASRQDVLNALGPPWAALGDRTYAYVNSKPSSHITVGYVAYGGAGDAFTATMTTKDFFLLVHFDEHGLVSRHEYYSDSLLHNHCFDSGICLTRTTLNALLVPNSLDEESKRFEQGNSYCSIYVFRDQPAETASENDYVTIELRRRTNDHILARGTSVEDGYSHWRLPQGDRYVVETRCQSVGDYPFDTTARVSRQRDTGLDFLCEPGGLYFIRLALPSSKRYPLLLERVEQETGKDRVRESVRLMDLYLGG